MTNIKKINYFLFSLFFISCTKNIDLFDKNDEKVFKIEQSKEIIKISLNDTLFREIELEKSQDEGFILKKRTNFLITQQVLNLKDSLFLTKNEFYKKYNIYDKEMNMNIFVNSFNYKIDKNLYVRQISFSPIPKYCIKIYYDSRFIIKKIYYKFGDEVISGVSNRFKITNRSKYNLFFNNVENDSLIEINKDFYIDDNL